MRQRFTVGGVTFDLRLTLLVIVGTILPMLDWYNHRIFSLKAHDRLVLYFVAPMAVILLLFREHPREYGWRWGRWREGLAWTLGVAVVIAPLLWFVARTETMADYYQGRAGDLSVLGILYVNAADLFGWEFIWRGFMLFGLARVLGPGPAIMLQAVPFAFMHLAKPELEALSTIFGGAGFGFVAWRSRSFLYPFSFTGLSPV